MSWTQFKNRDFLGTTPFQNLCCRQVRKFIPNLEFSEIGAFEKVFVAQIPDTQVMLTLDADSALICSGSSQLELNAAAFKQPEDLVARLIAELSNSI